MLTHYGPDALNAVSLYNAFMNDIQRFLDKNDNKTMKISNQMIGYHLTLKKLWNSITQHPAKQLPNRAFWVVLSVWLLLVGSLLKSKLNSILTHVCTYCIFLA